MSNRISKYLSYQEGIKSDTAIRKGIPNTPNSEEYNNMVYIATQIFDPVRDFVGGPLGATSFFRSPELNRAIGGSTTSQHCKGQAIDIDCDRYGYGSNDQIFHYIRENLWFDQLIWEFGNDTNPAWVHVSLNPEHKKNRQQILIAYSENGRTKYKPWN